MIFHKVNKGLARLDDQVIAQTKEMVANGKFYLRLLVICGLILMVRLVYVDVYYVPTSSMEDTIMAGDLVLVNKLVYNDRVLTCLGMTSLSAPKYRRGDIMVFGAPENFAEGSGNARVLIKRCLGVPGDSIELNGGQVALKSMSISCETMKLAYKARITNKACFEKLLPYFDGNQAVISNEGLVVNVSARMLDSLEKSCLEVLNEIHPRARVYESQGKVVIPSRGKSITLNRDNFHFYEPIIRLHEKKEAFMRSDSVFIEGLHVTSYRFSKDPSTGSTAGRGTRSTGLTPPAPRSPRRRPRRRWSQRPATQGRTRRARGSQHPRRRPGPRRDR